MIVLKARQQFASVSYTPAMMQAIVRFYIEDVFIQTNIF